MTNVCVIGAGVVGLSTAVILQERMSSPTVCKVTIISDRLGRHTVSYGSGGHIVPFPPDGIPERVANQWSSDSSEHFYRLAFSSESSESGVNLVSGFQLSDKEERSPFLQYFTNVKKMDQEVLKRFGRTVKQGYMATSPLVELPIYMKWLMTKFLSRGGTMIQRHVESLEELSGQYDVIVNCTGMGSRALTKDPLLRPIRGQVLHVKAPWIKNFVAVDATINIFPFTDSVLIGTVKQYDNDNMNISEDDSHNLLTKAQELFPPLKGARVMWEWVGMRPQRDPLRLEQETITTSQGKQLKVVHNYGHGSFGVSLSWGTGIHAAKLVEDILMKERKPSAKL